MTNSDTNKFKAPESHHEPVSMSERIMLREHLVHEAAAPVALLARADGYVSQSAEQAVESPSINTNYMVAETATSLQNEPANKFDTQPEAGDPDKDALRSQINAIFDEGNV